jgi:hypothetical protein
MSIGWFAAAPPLVIEQRRSSWRNDQFSFHHSSGPAETWSGITERRKTPIRSDTRIVFVRIVAKKPPCSFNIDLFE